MTGRLLTGAASILLLAELWAILFLRDGFLPDGTGVAAQGLTLGAALVCAAALAVIASRAGGIREELSRHGWRGAWRTRGWWVWACYVAYGAAVSVSAWAAGPGAYPGAVPEAWWFVALGIATAVIATSGQLRRAMLAVLLAGLAVLLLGVFGPKSGIDLDNRFLRYDSIVQWGAYPEIGMLAGLGAAAAMALLFTARNWALRVAAALLGAGFAAVPFLVNSRGAELAVLAMAAWLMLAAAVRGRQRLVLAAVAIGCVVVLTAGVVYRGPLTTRLARFGQSESSGGAANTSAGAASSRLEHWRVALAMTADHPWLGVGPGRYPLDYARYSSAPQQRHAHNMLLHVAAETGLLALIPFVMLWGRALWLTLRASGTDREGQAAFVLHAMLAAFFVRGMLDQFLSNVHSSLRTSLLIAILLGLAEAAARSRYAETAAAGVEESRKSRW